MEQKEIESPDPISTEENIQILIKRKEYTAQRINGFRFQWWILLIFLVVGGLLGYSVVAINSFKNYYSFFEALPFVIIGALTGGAIYGYATIFLRMTLQNKIRRIDYRLAQLGVKELQQNIEENFFTNLVQLNFKYLDQYYLQTQEQAGKSFTLASTASIIGLLIICAGIIMMFLDKTSPAYVTTGSGVISELVAALFFYLYNRTILKMSQYHQKLVITQNISLALKITEDMEKGAKQKVQEQIIDRLTIDINKYLSMN